MAKEIDQQLDDILNIESDIKKKTEIVKVPERSENIETDYRYARENLYGLVERGQDAIDGILQLSKETEHPRACLLYTSPSPRDLSTSRMPSSA